ncbi:class I SAM-dependent methyltransferase [Rhodopseudomonas sp. HC1]|uniref:DUF938 domain-containing protein n=1 Tax=Rhodopseudomonas infernalis TaxID=2897386 RepID=UPI001EE7B6B4|nr:DUF938 domain-containing protein [Rhodopseudomonas infernalis]MCG6207242.1 class I SAM-dependent methyltransferase [Rhodopseudomonas infernalis]
MADYVVEFGKNGRPVESDGRLDAAAFHRNQQAIREVLARLLHGATGDVLEAGSGTGQHVVAFARQHPEIIWWPSDIHPQHLSSIAAWRAEARLANIREPRRIDLADPAWPAGMVSDGGPETLAAVFSANVVHIAPWPVAQGLFAGAARLLRPDGRLILYGPFKQGGAHTAPSNAAFDASLRAANPEWGVRDVGELEQLGRSVGLRLVETAPMPANNLILCFARSGES